jgi:hypothetical protein
MYMYCSTRVETTRISYTIYGTSQKRGTQEARYVYAQSMVYEGTFFENQRKETQMNEWML